MTKRKATLEKEARKREIDAHVCQVFIEEGWNQVNLNRISKDMGMGKSTLQGYYPKKYDFGTVVTGELLPQFEEKLDFNSRQGFFESWSNLLSTDKDFREMILMVADNIVKFEGNESVQKPLRDLEEKLSPNIGSEAAKMAVRDVLGHFMYERCFAQSPD